MPGVFEEFAKRGFLYQCTDDEAVRKQLSTEQVTFYIGYDPTADSFHVGTLIPILAMVHLQRAGHRTISVIGNGTTMVGDPSGKTEMRKLMLQEQIAENGVKLRAQLEHFLELEGEKGLWVDNADWLLNLNYVDFLREIGRHFSVNRMLSAESYKIRLESGLSFLEFNYMLLQAYDFLVLYREHGCTMQFGGQDQWGNIVAGVDLIRRAEGGQAYGLTFPLLMNASGEKFGKTAAGAVWLDPDRTPVFDFYQFWRNTDDADVERLLKLFTFLPVDECERLGKLQPPLVNRAKEVLAFEVTALVHGAQAAADAFKTAVKHFPPADPDGKVETSSAVREIKLEATQKLPTVELSAEDIGDGLRATELYRLAGLCQSGGEARRLIRQGGARINDEQIKDETLIVTLDDLKSSPVLKAGKKRLVKVVLK